MKSLYNRIRSTCETFNIYHTSSTDPISIRRDVNATRLFIVLMIISGLILIMYGAFHMQIQTEIVQQPTQTMYETLQMTYGDTLRCSCQEISVPYAAFLQIEPSFHQVCTSDFVLQSWIDFVHPHNFSHLWPMDVRNGMSFMWQLISDLCRMSNKTLYDAFFEFAASPMISSTIIPKQLLEIRVTAALNLLYQTASDSLWQPLKLIHRLLEVEGYLTALSLNYALFLVDTSFDVSETVVTQEQLFAIPGKVGWCSQMRYGSCPMPGNLYLYNTWNAHGMYNLSSLVSNVTLPGLIVDCTPLQMMLSSSLECFYNQTCLDTLKRFYPNKNITIFTLDSNRKSRFLPTIPIQDLISTLFIEDIHHRVNFSSYYDECAPISCTYSFRSRFDWIYVITALISLVGGLSFILRLVAFYIVDIGISIVKALRAPTKSPTRKGTR